MSPYLPPQVDVETNPPDRGWWYNRFPGGAQTPISEPGIRRVTIRPADPREWQEGTLMRQTIDMDIAGAEEAEAGGTATAAGVIAVYDEEHDLPTNRLQSGQLHQSHQPHGMTPQVEDEADREWLTHLTARALTGAGTQGQAGPASSGMAQHSAPAAMVPTFGARASRMLGRVLVMAIYLLVIGVVATGAYLLASATWATGPNNTGMGAGSGSPSVGADSPRQGQDVGRPQARNSHEQQPAQGYGPGAGSGTTDSNSNSNSNSNSGANAGNEGMVVVPVAGTPAQLRDKGLQAYRAGNYERAITLLEQAVNLDGGDALTYYQLGLAYMAAPQREHAMEDAELAFRTAASLQPEWGAPYIGLAESLLRRDLYRDAIAPALQATRLEPRSVEAWLALGRAYKGAGQEAEATRAFAEAARLAPAPPAQP